MLNKERRIEEMNRIAYLVFEINGLEERKGRNGIAVFMNVSPHCRWMELSIYKRGWAKGAESETYRIKYNYTDDKAKNYEYTTVEEAIELLEELLEKQKAGDERRTKRQEKKRYDEAIEVFLDEIEWWACSSFDIIGIPEIAKKVANDYSKVLVDKNTMMKNMTKIVKDAMEEGDE